MGADNTFGETNFNTDKQCTCTPTDLQPFGECICGAERVSQDFQKERRRDILKDIMKTDEEYGMYEDSSRVIKMTKEMEEKRDEIVKNLANKVARDLGVTTWNKNLAEAPTTEYLLFVVDGEVKYGQKRKIYGEYKFEDLCAMISPEGGYDEYSVWEVEKWMLVPKP